MDELRDVFALFANKGLHGTHHGTLSISTKDLGTVIRPQPPEVGEDPPQPGRPLVEVVELAGAAELVARREDGAGVEKEDCPHAGRNSSGGLAGCAVRC